MRTTAELVWASAYGTAFALEVQKHSKESAHRRAKGIADDARDQFLRDKHSVR